MDYRKQLKDVLGYVLMPFLFCVCMSIAFGLYLIQYLQSSKPINFATDYILVFCLVPIIFFLMVFIVRSFNAGKVS
jgi:hypothetical protein